MLGVVIAITMKEEIMGFALKLVGKVSLIAVVVGLASCSPSTPATPSDTFLNSNVVVVAPAERIQYLSADFLNTGVKVTSKDSVTGALTIIKEASVKDFITEFNFKDQPGEWEKIDDKHWTYNAERKSFDGRHELDVSLFFEQLEEQNIVLFQRVIVNGKEHSSAGENLQIYLRGLKK